MSVYVAVYGTLRSDLRDEPYAFLPIMAEFADLVGPCKIRGDLLSVGAFPGLIEGEGSVVGQVWKVRPGKEKEAFEVLDQIEGYREESPGSSMYVRLKVRLVKPRRIRAHVYVWNGSRDLPTVEGGDWREHERMYEALRSQQERLVLPDLDVVNCIGCDEEVLVAHDVDGCVVCEDCWESLMAGP